MTKSVTKLVKELMMEMVKEQMELQSKYEAILQDRDAVREQLLQDQKRLVEIAMDRDSLKTMNGNLQVDIKILEDVRASLRDDCDKLRNEIKTLKEKNQKLLAKEARDGEQIEEQIKDNKKLEEENKKLEEENKKLKKETSTDDEDYIITDTGVKTWYDENCVPHRDGDKPAVIHPNGNVYYYKHGKLHRGGGKPAIIERDTDGTAQWYIEGTLTHGECGELFANNRCIGRKW
jgi:cell division protein FtsB